MLQVEKENFFHRISALSPSYKIPQRITKGISIGRASTSHNCSHHNEKCDRSHSATQFMVNSMKLSLTKSLYKIEVSTQNFCKNLEFSYSYFTSLAKKFYKMELFQQKSADVNLLDL